MQLKRNGAVFLTLVSLIIACMSMQASANVIGFDFGSTFFKITLVQPGNPFQIVENTTSKRKTESQLTITKEMRMYGADSFMATARNP
jgi:hypoxia up-regulated 1